MAVVGPDFSQYLLSADRGALRGALPRVRAPPAVGAPPDLRPVQAGPCPPPASDKRFLALKAGSSDDWINTIPVERHRERFRNLNSLPFTCAECGEENVSRLLSIGRRGCYLRVDDMAYNRYSYRVAADHRPPSVYAWTAGNNDTITIPNTVLDLMPEDVRPPDSARVEVDLGGSGSGGGGHYQQMIASSTAYSRYDIDTIHNVSTLIRTRSEHREPEDLFLELDARTSDLPWAIYHLSWPYPGERFRIDSPLVECARPPM